MCIRDRSPDAVCGQGLRGGDADVWQVCQLKGALALGDPLAAAEGLIATPTKMMYIESAVINMKARIQVYLDEEQDRLLEHLAKARRVSKSQLIRESIARYLEELIPPEEDPALGILGLAGMVGRKDLAERHNDYLVSIHSEERREDGQSQG